MPLVLKKGVLATEDQLLNTTEDAGSVRSMEQLEDRLTIHDFMKMQELFLVSVFTSKVEGFFLLLSKCHLMKDHSLPLTGEINRSMRT